jgi:hypothetical protein
MVTSHRRLTSGEWLMIGAIVVFAVLTLWLVPSAIGRELQLPPCPITYGLWQPGVDTDPKAQGVQFEARSEFQPGQIVYFQHRRTVNSPRTVWRVLRDSFEQEGDGLSLPAGEAANEAEPGVTERTDVRMIPWNIPPGRYRLSGFAEVHTVRPVQPTGYRSVYFDVRKP